MWLACGSMYVHVGDRALVCICTCTCVLGQRRAGRGEHSQRSVLPVSAHTALSLSSRSPFVSQRDWDSEVLVIVRRGVYIGRVPRRSRILCRSRKETAWPRPHHASAAESRGVYFIVRRSCGRGTLIKVHVHFAYTLQLTSPHILKVPRTAD